MTRLCKCKPCSRLQANICYSGGILGVPQPSSAAPWSKPFHAHVERAYDMYIHEILKEEEDGIQDTSIPCFYSNCPDRGQNNSSKAIPRRGSPRQETLAGLYGAELACSHGLRLRLAGAWGYYTYIYIYIYLFIYLFTYLFIHLFIFV